MSMTPPDPGKEREAVVRFIRADATISERLAARYRDGSMAGELNARSAEHTARIFAMLADAIERGDHIPNDGADHG